MSCWLKTVHALWDSPLSRVQVALAFALAFGPALFAQDFIRTVEGIPIERQGEIAAYPFFGGLDVFLPQFVDIDSDGDLDLFVAESNEVNWRLHYFENRGTLQAPDFHWRETDFDTLRIGNWFAFVDIDADGDADLYCADSGGEFDSSSRGGLRFYRNTGTPAQPRFFPESEEVRDTNGAKMASEPTSIPTFTDIDADGDLDFFTGVTTGTIRLYLNTGTRNVPAFTFATETWQNLSIISGGRTHAALATPNRPSENRHGANGICFADFDGDGDQDFFYGDLFHNGLYLLRNDGTPQNAAVTITDPNFPRPQSVQTTGFNIARFADLNADGALEFFAASIQQIQRRDNFLFYQNTGTPAQPQFNLATENFLSMLDVGSANNPALADLDADGDRDLLMGTDEGYFVYYRNVGAAAAPSLQWVSDNFQNLWPGTFFVATPAFVDIDNDGDFDLFSGYRFGTLAFFENRGTAQQPQFALVTTAFENIDTGDQAAPHFADLDRDGDFDLLVGDARFNVLHIFENIGSAQQPRFTLLQRAPYPVTIEESTPYTYDWNGDGILDLFSGNRLGTIVYFQGTARPDSFVLAEEKFAGIDVGFASAPVFTDFDSDGRIDLLVGERAGGLNFYRGMRAAAVQDRPLLPAAFDLSVYPNPMKEVLRISVRSAANEEPGLVPTLAIFNVLGVRLEEVPLRPHGSRFWLAEWRPHATPLAAGVYFVHLKAGSFQVARKVLLLR